MQTALEQCATFRNTIDAMLDNVKTAPGPTTRNDELERIEGACKLAFRLGIIDIDEWKDVTAEASQTTKQLALPLA